jgi:hypothetical protein
VTTPNSSVPPVLSAAPQPQSPAQAPFLTVHTAIILLAATVIGIVVGVLTFLVGHIVAAAILAGLCAFGGSTPVLRGLIA